MLKWMDFACVWILSTKWVSECPAGSLCWWSAAHVQCTHVCHLRIVSIEFEKAGSSQTQNGPNYDNNHFLAGANQTSQFIRSMQSAEHIFKFKSKSTWHEYDTNAHAYTLCTTCTQRAHARTVIFHDRARLIVSTALCGCRFHFNWIQTHLFTVYAFITIIVLNGAFVLLLLLYKNALLSFYRTRAPLNDAELRLLFLFSVYFLCAIDSIRFDSICFSFFGFFSLTNSLHFISFILFIYCKKSTKI